MEPQILSSRSKAGKLNVIVIGGSLGGLMQGIVLKRLGHNVHILEQKPSSALADLGAGIKVGPDAQEFFKNHDLVHEPYYVRCPGFQLVDNDSNVKRFDEQPMRMSSWSVLHHRLRANYDGYKSDFCPNPPVRSESDGDAVYDIGKKVTSLAHDKNGRVKIGFTDMINGGLEHFVWGDLVIAADGQSSTVRRMVMPEVKRTYAGYVGWRGFVPEQELSQETREVLDPRSSAFVFPGGYIISYMIPGGDGSIEVGKRRMNYVWYCICPESSAEFTELTTGKDGWKHRNFVPLGKVRDEVWAKQKAYAKEVLSPPFWEIIAKTVQPGLSIVHDYSASKAAFFDNKVLIVGEALALFRPHMGLSVNQAALHSLLLEKVMRGEMNVKAWERQVVQYGRQTQLKNEAMGNYYVFWGFPFFYSLLRYALSFIIQW